VPELADGFLFDQAELIPPGHFLPDWRLRESDLIWRIPYRGADGIQSVLVVVLLEHQSRADPRTPLRTLLYTVLRWDREWRDWEELPPPRPPFRLSPVLPIVFHTGSRLWGSHRTLAELIDAPAGLRPFVPQWQPLFWDLAAHTPESLWAMAGEWMQALAVLRVAEGEANEFQRVLAATLARLEGLADTAEVRWKETVKFVLGWALHHRPRAERDDLIAAGVASQSAAAHQGRLNIMGQTIAEALREEGMQQGMQQGMQEGELRSSRRTLRYLLEDRFGPLPVELAQRIAATTDLTRLETATRQVLRLNALDELQL
jgi:hypothetical protein